MYRLIRVNKRIPDGSIWQARRSYLAPPVHGWTRVYGPSGTRWSNPLGGWTTQHDGLSIFHPDRPFTISCHGPADQKRFYIDVAHRVRVEPTLVEFFDLYLDVMIDPSGSVSEKDEHQLVFLPATLRDFARASRDEVRRLIASGDPLFDPRSAFYAVPADAAALQAMTEDLELR
jgi:predicted RNA-binding protein associated with RNAse of E/G family